MRPQLVLGALLVAGALTIPPTAATAVGVDCTADIAIDNVDLDDATPARWDISPDGSVGDGALLDAPGGTSDRSDAYDSFTVFAIDDGTNGREVYSNPGSACTYEADGRQLAFPAETMTGGLELSRKVYVPASGPGFARFFNQVHNPTASAQTITVYTNDGQSADLGSDSSTTVTATSDGTAVSVVDDNFTTPYAWFATSDGGSDDDPQLAHNLDRAGTPTGSGVRDRVDVITQEDGEADELTFAYQNVTVPAGATIAYVSVESMRPSTNAAAEAAAYIDANPAVVLAGLSADEVASVQNWTFDRDGDGRADGTDNCPAVNNPTQADLDKDGQGDPCDADVDGDGIANEIEKAFGTNPLAVDSDADGVRDNLDNCPKVAGAGADGCPPATVVVNNVRRASKTKVKASESTKGPVVVTTKAKVKLKGTGTKRPRDCRNGLAQVLVKVGGLTVSNKIVTVSSTCRFKSKVTLDQPRRLVTKVVVTGRFLGSDGLLPSKKTIRVD